MLLEVCVCDLLRNVILQLVIRQRIVIRQLLMHEIQCSNYLGSFSVIGLGVISCLAMTRGGQMKTLLTICITIPNLKIRIGVYHFSCCEHSKSRKGLVFVLPVIVPTYLGT